MEREVASFIRQVVFELAAMETVGCAVSVQAYGMAINPIVMVEYMNMDVSACADLLRELYPAEGGASGQV